VATLPEREGEEAKSVALFQKLFVLPLREDPCEARRWVRRNPDADR
jgi:hypothetical protein